MKKTGVWLLFLVCAAFYINAGEAKKMDYLNDIHRLHHSSFRLNMGDKVIYIDPWEIKGGQTADYIFVTHEHYDHFSLEDIKKIADKNTVIICPKQVAEKLQGFTVKEVKPGDSFKLGKIKVEVVPAYNLKKPFHPKQDEKAGYVIDVNGVRIYHAGDTDFIPEMKDLKNITVALLPITGIFTMNALQAAQAVAAIKPVWAVPMHYGKALGGKKEVDAFEKNIKTPGVFFELKQED